MLTNAIADFDAAPSILLNAQSTAIHSRGQHISSVNSIFAGGAFDLQLMRSWGSLSRRDDGHSP
jgi:hypothetical protein